MVCLSVIEKASKGEEMTRRQAETSQERKKERGTLTAQCNIRGSTVIRPLILNACAEISNVYDSKFTAVLISP